MHETPTARGLRLMTTAPRFRAQAFGTRKTQWTLRRLAKLTPPEQAALEMHDAPGHVWRWIAWAPRLRERQIRLELALHLRREAPSGSWRWPLDREKGAALKAYAEAVELAHARGDARPAPTTITREAYEARIAEILASRPRRRGPRRAVASAPGGAASFAWWTPA